MSELDVAKEQIAYLKFWLGVMVVTDISVVGWLISNATHEHTPADQRLLCGRLNHRWHRHSSPAY